ncbi:Uncharacterized protein dnl_62940 [Desulfonema limicola]|uniref:Uncharacterized protein n=1 Tax=Desulfonema limicola TaxID=45656 RepID=A0A975BE61_9BACT|nr:Uncharacterized protein dnl_62940 [Desulfonema limicola]
MKKAIFLYQNAPYTHPDLYYFIIITINLFKACKHHVCKPFLFLFIV